jgi:low affinity Fe/Cu permease
MKGVIIIQALGLILLSIITYALYGMLYLFPINYLTNSSYEITPLLGDFFFFFGGNLTLFSVFFLSGYLLNKLKFYNEKWALFYIFVSTAVVLILLTVIVYDNRFILMLTKYLNYFMPLLAIGLSRKKLGLWLVNR